MGTSERTAAAVRRKAIYRFGLFEADSASGELHRAGTRVKLQDLPFRILCLLLEQAGEVVTREALRTHLWPPDTHVDFEGSLNVALKRLRYALDDSADNPIFIETVPKRGYRFIAPVESVYRVEDEMGGELLAEARPPSIAAEPAIRKISWNTLAAAAVLLGIVAVAVFVLVRKPHTQAPLPSVAVLPLQNQGAGSDLDYLRYSIADDIVTSLTSARSLSVRPFASTSALTTADPQEAGQRLKVGHVVSGSFIREGGDLRVTLEVTDVEQDHVLWRGTSTAPVDELPRLHQDVSQNVVQFIVPSLHASAPEHEDIPVVHDSRAFELYFRTLAAPRDPEPNKLTIPNIEQAVALDPNYGPAWGELAWRYYLDGQYSDGGAAAYAKAKAANDSAIALDPNGAYSNVILAVEQGDLNGAYKEARSFLDRRPDTPISHYHMSVVLRYAGLLDESARECDIANRMDPTYYMFRSCFIVFSHLGDYDRALAFIRLDGSSAWADANRTSILLRQNKLAEALESAKAAAAGKIPGAELQLAILQKRSPAEIAPLAREFEAFIVAQRDPEAKERAAELFSYGGQTDSALSFLRAAIQGSYCSLRAIETDPMFANVRHRSDYSQILALAGNCEKSFSTFRR